MIVETHLRTFAFTYEPGNSTSYRLVVTFDANLNIRCIAWPDMRWSCGDFGREVSAHWLRSSGRLKNKADANAIAEIVTHIVSCLSRGESPREVAGVLAWGETS